MVSTIHELCLGVQKVYKNSSTILENKCGFSIHYNKSKITYYVVKNYDEFEEVINKNKTHYNIINVYSKQELKFLTDLKYIKGTSSSINDNIINYKNLSKKQLSKLRRAHRFINREEFKVSNASKEEIDELTNSWIEEKYKDEKVFRITFSPKRYQNATLFLNNMDYNFYNVFYKNKLITSVCFYNDYLNKCSYHITYITDSKVDKLVNDQYELILWSAFLDRFNNGIDNICMGTSGGIKNLENFKKKFYTEKQDCYSYKLNNKIVHKGLFDKKGE